MIQTKLLGNRLVTRETELLEHEARLAMAMVERWGMIAAHEDSAGRQKLRLATPLELVERALAVAQIFMEQARARGLVHTTADITDQD